MTNEDYIKFLPRKELAITLINTSEVPDYRASDDCWDIPFEFWEDYEDTIEHECWWLAQEKEDDEI